MITYLSPKCLKRVGQIKQTAFFPQPRIQIILDKSPWDSTAIFVFSRFPLKTVHHFRNFLAVLPPPPYSKLKLGKNSGYTRPTLFVGWGEELDLCELENAQKRKSDPRPKVNFRTLNNMFFQRTFIADKSALLLLLHQKTYFAIQINLI